MEQVITVGGLHKNYGDLRALDNISFSVSRGEIFAYLGPNGAGKTTTISILCGLLRADEGNVEICGANIAKDPVGVKGKIGVVPDESNLYPELTCRRNLDYLGQLYGLSRTDRNDRVQYLLDSFGLTEKATAKFGSLSKGMKRRLTVAAALIHKPEVVFLDEPTAGLDVPSARGLRSLIREINGEGATVFLTTHNMEEARELSNRILILVKGRIVAEGTEEEISAMVEMSATLFVRFSVDVSREALMEACPAVKAAAVSNGGLNLHVENIHEAVEQVMSFSEAHALRVMEISTGPARFEDVFMSILQAHTKRR